MEIPQPQSDPMACPRCAKPAHFFLPHQMLSMDSAEVSEFELALQSHPHRVLLERLADRQVVWYFPDLYCGPWNGWDGRFGVCVCHSCGLRRKHDRLAG